MPARLPADGSSRLARTVALAFSAVMGVGACGLILQASETDGIDMLDLLRAFLILITTSWLAWGAAQALLGLVSRPAAPPPEGPRPAQPSRTVVMVPICNEDPVATFSRVAAMDASIIAAGLEEQVHFAILSDSRDEAVGQRERFWFARLLAECRAAGSGEGRIFYRRRTSNEGRKAGNIEEFVRRYGGAYEFAVILDADSLMEGATIAEMIRRMEAEPNLGLLQTLPKIIEARSAFGRSQQFSAAFYAPVFARGLAQMQGATGPFWGHNAIVRVRAFAESCGLPELSGPPPFGGPVLSHDYVEAALLARNGWIVRLDDDLQGSFEEGPENIISYARRDRRWAQGNLQHSRLVNAPGLRFWHRFVFIQGILAYLSSLIWGAFLIVSALSVLYVGRPNYFPLAHQLFPVFPDDQTKKIVGLAIGVVGLLVLPKLLIWVKATLDGRARGFGGAFWAFASFFSELLLSSLLAPVMLMFQGKAVLQVLSGRDGGWPANQRGEGRLSMVEGWAASGWISVTGAVGLVALYFFLPELTLWMTPVFAPMVLAPVLIAWSSRRLTGSLFLTPADMAPAPVVKAARAIHADWEADAERVEAAPARAAAVG
ncbi:glucans biosynthesis glucosyltransferase MdoH [Acidimangrovimonas sediminis]|uniref:glucans biosynthesis glucosyltransferase MdoH n=1 Tax=Acidimangrovimonas sediminis TaxID=2056283 RepID=UPI000C80798A|nr:glucans biosynthesis glucosyltransferase MdoH [Acidimangrovimonas sediminis]